MISSCLDLKLIVVVRVDLQVRIAVPDLLEKGLQA